MPDKKNIDYEGGEPSSAQIRNLLEAIWQKYIENGSAAVLYYFGLYLSEEKGNSHSCKRGMREFWERLELRWHCFFVHK